MISIALNTSEFPSVQIARHVWRNVTTRNDRSTALDTMCTGHMALPI